MQEIKNEIKEYGMESVNNARDKEIEYLAIEDLTPYEKNARTHDENQIEKLKNSLEEFGFINPVIIDENNMILVGHGRIMGAKELGIKTVPCIRIKYLTEDQKKAYILADNKLSDLGGWDLDLLNEELASIELDMSMFGFEEIEEPEIEIEDDDFDIEDLEPVKEPKSKRGEIYKLGNHYLMCGDSTNPDDVKKLMNGAVADLVVTDPPYNVAISNSQGMTIENDDMADKDFKEFLYKAFNCLNNNLKEGGAFYVWYASKEHINFEQALNENGLYVRQCLIWVKQHFNLGRQDYKWKHEPCLYGWKDGASHYFIDEFNHPTVIEDKIDFDSLKKEEAIQMLKDIYEDGISTTVIHEDKPTINDLHPTMKPLRLLARLIRNSSKENEIVLDLFGGSGSTLITCEQLDRICYTMEYDPIYVDAIIERYETFTGNKAVKIN